MWPLLLQLPGQGQATDTRHDDVGKNRINIALGATELSKGLFGRGDQKDAVAMVLENLRSKVA